MLYKILEFAVIIFIVYCTAYYSIKRYKNSNNCGGGCQNCPYGSSCEKNINLKNKEK